MTESNNTNNNYEVPIPRSIRFWLLLTFNIPALICTLFLLYHILRKRTLRQALHNHAIIVLLFLALFCCSVDVSSYIVFVQLGYVWLPQTTFCLIWSFIDIGLFGMISILLAWTAFERHLLVFHQNWLNTRRKQYLFHYFPLCLIIFYDILFYVIVIMFPSCENIYDFTQPWCGYPCYYDEPVLARYDNIVNWFVPMILVIIFTMTLLIRFVYHKQRVQQAIQWRKHRRMIIQLLSISFVPVIFNSPMLCLYIAHYCGLPSDVGVDLQLYFYFFNYFVALLLPYVCLASLPEILNKFNMHPIKWIQTQFQHTNTVAA